MGPTVIRSIALALLLSAGAATAQPAPITAIKAGRLIADPARDRGAPALILVEGSRIRAVLPADAPVPEGARLVDLSDATVLPGLIDLHVHLTSDPGRSPLHVAQTTSERSVATGARNALLTVKAGFTTVRDLGAPPLASLALRDAIAAGDLVGPRIQAAGAGISIIGGHADVSGFRPDVNEVLSSGSSCTGPEQCAARVREAARRGVDVIKITATGGVLSQQARGLELHFTPAEMKAIVETADSLGLKVMAHAHGDSGIRGAVEAGVSTVEHGTFASAETLRLMRQKGSWYVPTLMAFQGLADRVGKGIFTPVVELKAKAALAQWGNGLAAAVRAGVPIAFGTDAGVFEHGRNGEEFALMVEKGGMSPRAALVAATVDAARAAGLSDEIGTIAPGKAADIVAVSGDPLADPRTLQKMRFVMANGRIVPLD